MIEPSREIALLILFACCIIIGLTGSAFSKKYTVWANEYQTLIVRKKRKIRDGSFGMEKKGKTVGEKEVSRTDEGTRLEKDDRHIKVMPFGSEMIFPSRPEYVLLDHKTRTFELTIQDILIIGGDRIDMDAYFSYSVDKELVLDRKIAKKFLDRTIDEIDAVALNILDRALREACSNFTCEEIRTYSIKVAYMVRDAAKIDLTREGLKANIFNLKMITTAEDVLDRIQQEKDLGEITAAD